MSSSTPRRQNSSRWFTMHKNLVWSRYSPSSFTICMNLSPERSNGFHFNPGFWALKELEIEVGRLLDDEELSGFFLVILYSKKMEYLLLIKHCQVFEIDERFEGVMNHNFGKRIKHLETPFHLILAFICSVTLYHEKKETLQVRFLDRTCSNFYSCVKFVHFSIRFYWNWTNFYCCKP